MNPDKMQKTGDNIATVGKLGCLLTLMIFLLGFLVVVIWMIVIMAGG